MNKKNILKKNWEFQNIIESRKQVVSRTLIAYHQKNDGELRVGISISKKFAGAVKRNYYRRQTRQILDMLNLWERGFDVVLILRKSFLFLPFDRKRNEILKILERLK